MFTHHLIKRSLAGGLVVAGAALGVGAGPASARPYNLNANGSYVPAQVATLQAGSHASLRVSARSGGFDWGDAGIGAAGSAVVLVGLLGGGLTRRRRGHQTAIS